MAKDTLFIFEGVKMKRFFSQFNFFLFGFAIAFILLNFTMCPEKATGPSDDNSTGIEPADLKTFAKRAENAFLSGQKDSVLAITYEEWAEACKDYITSDPEKLKKFGEALSRKKLIYGTNPYAEYEITIDGEKFTVAFAQSGDGNWKLVRY
jgi:hypothetical protein